MFNWKVEDLSLSKSGYTSIASFGRFIETLTKKEKLNFLNTMSNGDLSYILNKVQEFEKVRADITQNIYFQYELSSPDIKELRCQDAFREWLVKNDSKELFDKSHTSATIFKSDTFVGVTIGVDAIFQHSGYNNLTDWVIKKGMMPQLIEASHLESIYHKSTAPIEIARKKFKENVKTYGTTFGLNIKFDNIEDVGVGVLTLAPYIKDQDGEHLLTLKEITFLNTKYQELKVVTDAFATQVAIDFQENKELELSEDEINRD